MILSPQPFTSSVDAISQSLESEGSILSSLAQASAILRTTSTFLLYIGRVRLLSGTDRICPAVFSCRLYAIRCRFIVDSCSSIIFGEDCFSPSSAFGSSAGYSHSHSMVLVLSSLSEGDGGRRRFKSLLQELRSRLPFIFFVGAIFRREMFLWFWPKERRCVSGEFTIVQLCLEGLTYYASSLFPFVASSTFSAINFSIPPTTVSSQTDSVCIFV